MPRRSHPLYARPSGSTHSGARARCAWSATLLGLALVLGGCSEDPPPAAGGGGGGVADVEGSWGIAPAPATAPAMAAEAPSSACTLDLSSFAIVQDGRDLVLLHGLAGGGDGLIPGRANDEDQIVFDIAVGAGGETTTISGLLDVVDDGQRLAGDITIEITGAGPADCMETTMVSADRSGALPGPAPELVNADGTWDLTTSLLETTCQTTLEGVPLGTTQVSVTVDAPVAGQAFIDIDGLPAAIQADMIDRYLVASWERDLGGEDLQQSLTVLWYRPADIILPELLIGFTGSLRTGSTEICEELLEHQAIRPPI